MIAIFFKVFLLFILFSFLRGVFQLYRTYRALKKRAGNNNAKAEQRASDIEAEYTVLDDKD